MSVQSSQSDLNNNTYTPDQNHHQTLGCSNCQRRFFADLALSGRTCPLCQAGMLEVQISDALSLNPEAILPFSVDKKHLPSIIAKFVGGVWIKPKDFKTENLLNRTFPLFWPMWLVDCDTTGHWQVEAGFDYQVESAKEAYVNGQWRSIKEIKDRIRWEPRLGEIARRVENVAVPALKEHQNRISLTGNYNLENSEPFVEDLTDNALLEVPDLPTDAAWPLAKPIVNHNIENICIQASGAQHSQKFKLNAAYTNLNWTQFYLPLYATYYRDDEGLAQIVIINGETGSIRGPQLASRKRGLKIAGIIAAIAGALFLIALLGLLFSLIWPDAGWIAGLFGILGLFTGLTAIIPAVWPGQWNRKHNTPRIVDHR